MQIISSSTHSAPKYFCTLFLIIAALLAMNCPQSFSQTISNYTFNATAGSFTTITGGVSTSLSGGGLDDGYFNALPIGFDFWYMGNKYNTVSASTNGWLTLGANINPPTSFFEPNDLRNGGTPRPVIAPIWDDLSIASTNNVSYNVTGSAPNRVFTIQYLNVKWDYGAASPAISFQVKLYENSGKVEYIYRPEAGAVNRGSGSIGISASATGSGNFLSLNNSGTAPTASSTTETTGIDAKPVSGQTYSFIPAKPNAPTSLSFTNVGVTSMTLNWIDNSGIETGYEIYRSTDNVNFNFVIKTAANAQLSAQTGLTPGTNYYWKIYAVRETASNVLTGSQCTSNDALISYPASPYCSNAGMVSVVRTASVGSSSGTYSSTPGLSINSVTGQVNLTASIAGTYTVTNTIASGSCAGYTATTIITVKSAPDLSAITATNLIARYKFSGNANDASGNNNGTLQNAPSLTADRFGNANSAYSFNGTSQYVSTANSYPNPAAQQFTVSIWFNTTSVTGGKLIGFGNTQTGLEDNYDRHLYMNNIGQIYFGVYTGSAQTIQSSSTYNDGKWHQATATLSSANGLVLYMDGIQVAANASVTTAEIYTGYWRIGYGNLNGWPSAPTNQYFTGILDDVEVYHRALSASEVSTLYSSPEGVSNNRPTCAGSSLTLTGPSISGAT